MATAEQVGIHWASTEQEMRGAISVREEVFCREQGVSREEELDGCDEEALHVVGIDPASGRVIATLRLLLVGERAKVGRVAVERAWRRRGIAARMLELALAKAREGGCTEARLAAQLEATSLYEQAGFAIESDEFEEAEIPHVWMGRKL